MESMPSFANIFLWIAMFFAIGYAVIYMAIIVHGIMQDPDKKTYTRLRNKLRMPLKRKKSQEPIDVEGIKRESKWNTNYTKPGPLPR